MKKRRGYLPVYTPPEVANPGTSSSSSSAPNDTVLDLVGGDLSESEAQYYRALGLLPTRSRKRPQQPQATSASRQPTKALTPNTQAPEAPNPDTSGSRIGSSGLKRKDAPIINYSRGASSSKSHNSDFNRSELLERLESDVSARSAQSSNNSLTKTWTKFHHEWFLGKTEPFPITSEALKAVAALFKARGYRSFENYLSRAKREHILFGFAWTQELDIIARDCVRSVTRGVGPSRQSAEFDLVKIVALEIGTDPVCDDGPVNPKAMCVLGSFFLTREIEISLAFAVHFRIIDGPTGPEVEWRLPVSKTDPRAVSVTRTWKCLCSSTQPFPCPSHTAVSHLDDLRSRFGIDGSLPDSLPLFPTRDGNISEKSKVVQTLEALASRCGASLVDDLGRRAFGGHSFRISGSRMLASMGLELSKIALLARWASNIIMRYVSEAPLVTLSEDCRRLLDGADSARALDELRSELRKCTDKLTELETRVKLSELREPEVKPDSQTRYVLNSISGVWHTSFVCNSRVSPLLWQTKCGWRFGNSVVEHAESLPDDLLRERCCNRCLPEVARGASAASAESSGSSS
jgi:hypothetical protein